MEQLQLPVRNAHLYMALRGIVEAAFFLLHSDVDAGAEVSFSISEHRNLERSPFYEYRPWIEDFVNERRERIRQIDSVASDLHSIAGDPAVSNFLRAGRIEAVHDADQIAFDEIAMPMIMAMAEAFPGFEMDEDTFTAQYSRWEGILYAETRRFVAITPLWGVRLPYGDVELAGGVAIRKISPDELRIEWPEAAQLNWGIDFNGNVPDVALYFERAVGADEEDTALDPVPAITQVVSVVRVLAGGSVSAGPFVMERFDFRSLAPRPVSPVAAVRCGLMPSRIDAMVIRHLPGALRRLSSDPHGLLGRSVNRYHTASSQKGFESLNACVETLLDIYAEGNEPGVAALRLAAVLGANTQERMHLRESFLEGYRAVRDAKGMNDHLLALRRVLCAALRGTLAAALAGEMPLTEIRTYADSVLLGAAERQAFAGFASADIR